MVIVACGVRLGYSGWLESSEVGSEVGMSSGACTTPRMLWIQVLRLQGDGHNSVKSALPVLDFLLAPLKPAKNYCHQASASAMRASEPFSWAPRPEVRPQEACNPQTASTQCPTILRSRMTRAFGQKPQAYQKTSKVSGWLHGACRPQCQASGRALLGWLRFRDPEPLNP